MGLRSIAASPTPIAPTRDRAIADFTTAFGINSREVEAYNSRGIAYRRNGNCDLAIADYDKAIEIRPGDPAYYNNRGVAYSCALDYRPAIADYNSAIAINPRYAEPYMNRGSASLAKGDYNRALADYSKSHKDQAPNTQKPTTTAAPPTSKTATGNTPSPTSAPLSCSSRRTRSAYSNRAWSYFKTGKAAPGLPDAERSLQLRPDDAATLGTRSLIYEALRPPRGGHCRLPASAHRWTRT